MRHVEYGIQHQLLRPFIVGALVASLSAHQFLQFLRVSSTLQRDLGSCNVQLSKVFRCKLDSDGPDVLFKPMQLRRTGDRYDPRPLRQQPCESNLSRCHFLLFGKLANQID